MNAECFNDVIGNAFPTSKNEGQKTTYNMTLGKPMNLAYSTLGSDKCLALTANSTQYYETNQVSKACCDVCSMKGTPSIQQIDNGARYSFHYPLSQNCEPSSVGIMPGRQFPPLYYGVRGFSHDDFTS